ncbi:MAG: YIP1 family protein [Desulfotomaculaceae bacterium]|nr:YIP1 family protein [Desulfotomaculaceae bacterium]
MIEDLSDRSSEKVQIGTDADPSKRNTWITADESISAEDDLATSKSKWGPPGGIIQTGQVFLELFYGVLFKPVKTMESVALCPPVGVAFIVVTIISILSLVTGYFAVSQLFTANLPGGGLAQILTVLSDLLPYWVVFGLLWGYLKWFGFSAALHLFAGLLGGGGAAAGVFAAVGLANLPSILFIPVNLLIYMMGEGKVIVTVLSGVTGLIVVVWTAILLVIGLKQVHGLTTGWSVLIVFSPFLTLAVLAIFMFVVLVGTIGSQPVGIYHHGLF